MGKKRCSQCASEWPETMKHCPKDGTKLALLPNGPLVGGVLADKYYLADLLVSTPALASGTSVHPAKNTRDYSTSGDITSPIPSSNLHTSSNQSLQRSPLATHHPILF